MSKGKVVLGTLVGLAIGAIAGILFAPKKGSKTRKQIMDKGDDFVHDMKSKFNEFIGTISEKEAAIKKNTEEIINSGKSNIDDAKKEAKNLTSDIKHNNV